MTLVSCFLEARLPSKCLVDVNGEEIQIISKDLRFQMSAEQVVEVPMPLCVGEIADVVQFIPQHMSALPRNRSSTVGMGRSSSRRRPWNSVASKWCLGTNSQLPLLTTPDTRVRDVPGAGREPTKLRIVVLSQQ